MALWQKQKSLEVAEEKWESCNMILNIGSVSKAYKWFKANILSKSNIICFHGIHYTIIACNHILRVQKPIG